MPQGDGGVSVIALDELGEMVGHQIVETREDPLLDRYADQRRRERLGHRERGLLGVVTRAVEVLLVEHVVASEHDECRRLIARE